MQFCCRRVTFAPNYQPSNPPSKLQLTDDRNPCSSSSFSSIRSIGPWIRVDPAHADCGPTTWRTASDELDQLLDGWIESLPPHVSVTGRALDQQQQFDEWAPERAPAIVAAVVVGVGEAIVRKQVNTLRESNLVQFRSARGTPSLWSLSSVRLLLYCGCVSRAMCVTRRYE